MEQFKDIRENTVEFCGTSTQVLTKPCCEQEGILRFLEVKMLPTSFSTWNNVLKNYMYGCYREYNMTIFANLLAFP
jgi:hypothetical protein